MTEWQVIRLYETVLEHACRLEFDIDNRCGEYPIAIIALKPPYVSNTTVFQCATLNQALAWLQGYSQREFEI